MSAMASQITRLPIVYSTVYLGADQRKYQSSASLAFVRGIHRWPVNSLYKWPVTRKMFQYLVQKPCALLLQRPDVVTLAKQIRMMTSSNGNISTLLAICEGNSPVTGEFPAQRPVTRSFDVFFHLRLNERLSKQWWGWWFETPSRPLWRYCNGMVHNHVFLIPRNELLEPEVGLSTVPNYLPEGPWEDTMWYLPPAQNGRHFADDIFSCIFVNEKFCILI